MSIILKAENISKQYRLGQVGTGTLSHDLNRWWHTVRGKEDPYLKVGGVNIRNAKATEDYVWALKDVNFEVKQGEVLGIIGKNGAGKSTLLKILSRVTAPTTGNIKIKGRIASLLEIGTGFHPELTGRENIFMNGAVLGMTKSEIKNKLDEIISFSGCEMYIDTPVKRYSSGMTVRLGFAVAAHLEPEILVVDEVLAVGDAEFQKKALGKMQDLSQGEGRTVLFVSHNMGSIKSLCSSCLVLNNGHIDYIGESENAINKYLTNDVLKFDKELISRKDRYGSGDVQFQKIIYLNGELKPVKSPISGEPLIIRLFFKANRRVQKLLVGVGFYNNKGIYMTGINSDEHGYFLTTESGYGHIDLIFERLHLFAGIYYLNLILSEYGTTDENKLDFIENAVELEVLSGDFWKVGKNNRHRNVPIINGAFRLSMKND